MGCATPQTRFCMAMERAKTSRPQPKSAETGCTNRPKPARMPKASSNTIEPQASTSIGLRQKLGEETRGAGGAAGALVMYPARLTPGARQNRALWRPGEAAARSEEHTSELQSLMRISYAVFCLKQKNTQH